MRNLLHDERGTVFAQVAALIIAPLVTIILATAAISAVRTGAGVTDVLTRSAHSQIVFDDFVHTINDSSTVTAVRPTRLDVTIDPADLPEALSRDTGTYPDTCVSIIWQIAGDTLRTLEQTTRTHQSGCSSPVAQTTTSTLTGLTSDTRFRYENPAGRTLTASGGTLVPATGEAPAGVSASAWASTQLSAIRLEGTVQELLSDRKIRISAYTGYHAAP